MGVGVGWFSKSVTKVESVILGVNKEVLWVNMKGFEALLMRHFSKIVISDSFWVWPATIFQNQYDFEPQIDYFWRPYWPFSRLRLLSFEAILNDLGELLTKIFYFINPSFFNFFDRTFKDQGTFLFIKDALFHFLNTYFSLYLGCLLYLFFRAISKIKLKTKLIFRSRFFIFTCTFQKINPTPHTHTPLHPTLNSITPL